MSAYSILRIATLVLLLTSVATCTAAGLNSPQSDQQPESNAIEEDNPSPLLASELESRCVECEPRTSDRIWLVSSRHLTSNTCQANLDSPCLMVARLNECGRRFHTSQSDYLASTQQRLVVFYVHGNRIGSDDAAERGLTIRKHVRQSGLCAPIDWVIFSWPSSKQCFPFKDAREKAARTDAHGLYLAWLLRQQVRSGSRIAMIGYSFGGRMITGSLHALAGGSLGGRSLPGEAVLGTDISVGLAAPAVDSTWLQPGRYHGLATKNMDELTLLYNPRDIALKNYWRLTKTRGQQALGTVRQTLYGYRADGSRLPVRFHDCSDKLGTHHREAEYYEAGCNAGFRMAFMVNQKILSRKASTNIVSGPPVSSPSLPQKSLFPDYLFSTQSALSNKLSILNTP